MSPSKPMLSLSDSEDLPQKRSGRIKTEEFQNDKTEDNSSSSSSESESDEEENSSTDGDEQSNDEEEQPNNKTKDEYVQIGVPTSDAMPSSNMLDDDDNELWLVRVPRHESLTSNLHGTVIELPDRDLEKGYGDRILSAFRGSYVFRDHGAQGVEKLRAGFLRQDENGPKYEIAKPFKRYVAITFNMQLVNLEHPAPPRRYSPYPKNLKLQYRPIGGSRELKRTRSDEERGNYKQIKQKRSR